MQLDILENLSMQTVIDYYWLNDTSIFFKRLFYIFLLFVAVLSFDLGYSISKKDFIQFDVVID